MNRCIEALLTCALLAALPSAALAQKQTGKKLYCWDENGVQVCGDTLPPSALDRARTEISSNTGNRTGEVARALTGDEREAAALAAEAARQIAEAEAIALRRDLAMIESYTTEADLRRAFAERITLNDESIKSSQMSIGTQRQSLLSLLRQAAEIELQAKPVSKPLANKIVQQHAGLLRLQGILRNQVKQGSELDDDLDDALKRYRAMKLPSEA